MAEPQRPLPPPVAPPPAPRWPGAAGWFGRALVWLFGALAGAGLAGALLLGAWAASEGSLAQALRWGLAWQAETAPEAGRSQAEGVSGSLIGGGQVQALGWSRDGLSVQVEGLRLRLGCQQSCGQSRQQCRGGGNGLRHGYRGRRRNGGRHGGRRQEGQGRGGSPCRAGLVDGHC